MISFTYQGVARLVHAPGSGLQALKNKSTASQLAACAAAAAGGSASAWGAPLVQHTRASQRARCRRSACASPCFRPRSTVCCAQTRSGWTSPGGGARAQGRGVRGHLWSAAAACVVLTPPPPARPPTHLCMSRQRSVPHQRDSAAGEQQGGARVPQGVGARAAWRGPHAGGGPPRPPPPPLLVTRALTRGAPCTRCALPAPRLYRGSCRLRRSSKTRVERGGSGRRCGGVGGCSAAEPLPHARAPVWTAGTAHQRASAAPRAGIHPSGPGCVRRCRAPRPAPPQLAPPTPCSSRRRVSCSSRAASSRAALQLAATAARANAKCAIGGAIAGSPAARAQSLCRWAPHARGGGRARDWRRGRHARVLPLVPKSYARPRAAAARLVANPLGGVRRGSEARARGTAAYETAGAAAAAAAPGPGAAPCTGGAVRCCNPAAAKTSPWGAHLPAAAVK